jgi:hypothetical protein
LLFIAAADASAIACVLCADVLRTAFLGRLSEQASAREAASRREAHWGRPLEALAIALANKARTHRMERAGSQSYL